MFRSEYDCLKNSRFCSTKMTIEIALKTCFYTFMKKLK